MLVCGACENDTPDSSPQQERAPVPRATSATPQERTTSVVEAFSVALDPAMPAARVFDVTLQFDRLPEFETSPLQSANGSVAGQPLVRFLSTRARADVRDRLVVGSSFALRLSAETDGSTSLALQAIDGSADGTAGARVHAYALPDPTRVVVHVSLEANATAAATGALVHDLRVVMLDPGHGGDDHGAPSGELRESTLVLDIAKRVRERLRTRLPNAQTLLTRDNDTFVSLQQRAAMANAARADLFVSIHLNASPTEAERGGVTTFVLDTSGDRQAIRLAALENGTSEREVTDLGALVASLERRDQVAEARMLASRVHFATLSSARRYVPNLYDRGVRAAPFAVLVGARMPALLIEASFLLRAPEAPFLARQDYRDALAEGIAEGIVRHAEGR